MSRDMLSQMAREGLSSAAEKLHGVLGNMDFMGKQRTEFKEESEEFKAGSRQPDLQLNFSDDENIEAEYGRDWNIGMNKEEHKKVAEPAPLPVRK